MNNLIIAEQFHQLSKLMELHQENPFKVKAIANAASIIEKLNQDINIENYSQLSSIKGIGKNILEKVHEILLYGSISELKHYEQITPESVIELLNIKGLGPARVYKLWKEHDITSAKQLIDAIKNNQLQKIKGFTEKTLQTILDNTLFYLENKDKLQLGVALSIAQQIIELLQEHSIKAEITGELRRHCEVVTVIELITTSKISEQLIKKAQQLSPIPVIIHQTDHQHYFYDLFQTTGSKGFLDTLPALHKKIFSSEEEIFNALKSPYIIPPQRESAKEHHLVKQISYQAHPVQYQDFKGILHCHTTYSDGVHTLKEMADYCKEQGFEYLGICDHSQTAKYAGGLEPKRILQQWEEIDEYNHHHKNFKILKGIESDILSNGDLDYDDDILKQFDFVVASIHQHFDMTEAEATARLIKAIENPYTSILGHLTGRLLLIRKGYPVNHQKIIDACAANNVIIELNANTYRLDIDWRWLQYCMEKGVKIAINPDAHSKTAIHDTKYGVMVAQKAGLVKEMVVNTFSLKDIQKLFKKI